MQRGFTIIELLGSLVVASIAATLVALVVGAPIFNLNPSNRCEARWEKSGYEVSYTRAGGCKVKLKDGRWVPETSVKEHV